MERTQERETVPRWDGQADSFNEFEDRCIWYERSLSEKDKPQAVARIVGKLSGTSWKLIQDLTTEDQGRLCESSVQELTQYLRSSILEIGVPEVGKRFNEYLGRFGRKKGQTMRTYIQNHRHLKIKVEEAIKSSEVKRVEKLKFREQLKTIVLEAKKADEAKKAEEEAKKAGWGGVNDVDTKRWRWKRKRRSAATTNSRGDTLLSQWLRK